MLGFSGRTGRATFAVVGGLCYLSGPILLAAQPWIEGLRALDADAAMWVGTLMAVAAVGWSLAMGFAWLLFSVRRLRDAGLSVWLASASVVLGFLNDPRTLIDPSAWAERPLFAVTSLLCLIWLGALIALPSRPAPEVVAPVEAPPVRRTPGPVAPRKQFGLR
ncbi:DUF805 domain-containing protein [Brevundimonas staleyi]|uniref:DUF805 domain-containing protein n=1 Tax=Brevundimonas staleyi TaxID=74326 RepID=A0ABW0FVB5_9CAUL